jgi:hypothetical protein
MYHYNNDPVAQAVDIDKKKRSKETAKAMMATLMMELNITQPSVEPEA